MPWVVRITAFLLISFSLFASPKVTVQRNGASWIVTVAEALPLERLTRIAAAGDLVVRGRHAKELRYTVSQQVVAPDEASARIAATLLMPQAGSGQLLFAHGTSVHLDLPHDTRNIIIESIAGTLDVSDLAGPLRAATGAGKIVLDRIAGDVDVSSAGGPTLLGTIGGSVRVHSEGGPIRAVNIRGGALLQTGGGDIRMGLVSGKVEAFTGAGGIQIDEAGSEVFAETSGGPVTILKAHGAVVANSAGGPIEVAAASAVQCRSASGTIRLNNVSGALRATTGRGDIVAELLKGHPLGESLLMTHGGDITVFIPSDMGVTIEAQTRSTAGNEAIVSDFPGLQVSSTPSVVVARVNVNGGGPKLRLMGVAGRIEIKRK